MHATGRIVAGETKSGGAAGKRKGKIEREKEFGAKATKIAPEPENNRTLSETLNFIKIWTVGANEEEARRGRGEKERRGGESSLGGFCS